MLYVLEAQGIYRELAPEGTTHRESAWVLYVPSVGPCSTPQARAMPRFIGTRGTVAIGVASSVHADCCYRGRTVAHPTHRWLIIAIFAYFIFSPVLGIIPSMKQPAVIVVLWVIIGAHTRVEATRGASHGAGRAMERRASHTARL